MKRSGSITDNLEERIAVLLGGVSSEREVSLSSGRALEASLRRLGKTVITIDTREGRSLPATLIEQRIDTAVIALHGPMGEDGTIQGMLEIMGIPYTGSGPTASALCMDKGLCKRLFRDAGLPTPPWREADVHPDGSIHWLDDTDDLKAPLYVKPLRSGSSVGVLPVNEGDRLDQRLREAAGSTAGEGEIIRVMAEQGIRGREVTLPILDGKTLPLIEIRPKKGFYNYANKYTVGQTDYLIPPPGLSREVAERIRRVGLAAGKLLGCRGLYRVDMMVDADDRPWLLEINTIPGLTETSLAPRSAAAANIPFDALAERILAGAGLEACYENCWPVSS